MVKYGVIKLAGDGGNIIGAFVHSMHDEEPRARAAANWTLRSPKSMFEVHPVLDTACTGDEYVSVAVFAAIGVE